MNFRPLATFALIAASGFWACEPDLGALSSSYQPSGGSAGTTPDSGGTGGVSGTNPTGGTGGDVSPTGGTGGDVTNPEGGSGDLAGAAGEQPTGGTGATGGGGTGARGGTGGSAGTGGATSTCTDGKTDAGETDVDCGGTSKCGPCGNDSSCLSNNDCLSKYCKNSVCTKTGCSDGVKNGDETGKDCGGSCLGCADGVACLVDDDCAGQYCDAGVCTDHCTSMRQDADETDIDCGGLDCGPCDAKKKCIRAEDCSSLNCSNQKCVAATCSDTIQNQGEGAVDCGAVCADQMKWCSSATRQTCNLAADCDSSICTTGHCVPDTVTIPTGDMIDDFEGGIGQQLPATNGRKGNWYAFNDMTTGWMQNTFYEATITGHRGMNSAHAIHTSGSGFTNWGAGIGADLNNGSTKQPYDASFDDGGTPTPYAGVMFWARSDGGPLSLTLALPDGDTDAAGGICNQTGGMCDHHYLGSVTLGSDWQRYTVLFKDLILEPGDVPQPGPFDPTRLVSVQFRVSANAPFDFWVDDVAFVRPQQ